MVLYLPPRRRRGLIVLLVVHLTKAGANSGRRRRLDAHHQRPGRRVRDQVRVRGGAKAGPFPLNSAATKNLAQQAESAAAPVVAQIKARGAGQPGQSVFAMYDLGSNTQTASSSYKGVAFVGYDGTFNMTAVIKYEKTQLKSSRMVAPARTAAR